MAIYQQNNREARPLFSFVICFLSVLIKGAQTSSGLYKELELLLQIHF